MTIGGKYKWKPLNDGAGPGAYAAAEAK